MRRNGRVNVSCKNKCCHSLQILQGHLKNKPFSISLQSLLYWMSNLTTCDLCGPSNCVSVLCVFFRPRGRWAEGIGPQLPPVLPISLSFGAAQRAAVVTAHRPHSAGAGGHRCIGREHKDPVLPGHLRKPRPAAEWEHLRRVRWVWQLEILDKLSY